MRALGNGDRCRHADGQVVCFAALAA
jgi:hypothetical protein